MRDATRVIDLRPRRRGGASNLWRLDRAAEEDGHLEELLLGTDEEVAGLAREHDRLVRGVDPLFAKTGARPAQPLPGLAQILRQVRGQRRLGRRPAVVRLAGFDPLLAVIALVPGHSRILPARTGQPTRVNASVK